MTKILALALIIAPILYALQQPEPTFTHVAYIVLGTAIGLALASIDTANVK